MVFTLRSQLMARSHQCIESKIMNIDEIIQEEGIDYTRVTRALEFLGMAIFK